MATELEARFHHITLPIFETFRLPSPSIESVSLIYPGNIRVVTENGKKTTTRKENKRGFPIPHPWGNLVEAVETTLQVSPTGNPIMTRHRKRWSTLLPHGSTLDVTETLTTGASNPRLNGIRYEIEVEVVNPTVTQRENFEKDRLLVETRIAHVRRIISIFNGSDNDSLLGVHVLARPRNLKRDDFSSYFNAEFQRPLNGYTVTPKADGIQRCLFIDPNGMYWVYPPKLIEKIPNAMGTDQTFLLVGELIPAKNRTDGKGKDLYCPFDVLYADVDIRDSRIHDERMTFARALANQFPSDQIPFEFYVKEFYDIGETPESFAIAYDKAINDHVPFHTDGAIMTPSFGSHNPIREYIPITRRRLCVQPDLCKIKPAHLLTIDFRVINGRLHSYGRNEKKDIPFPPPKKKLRYPDPIITHDLSSYEGLIIEFSPLPTANGWSLVPGRTRDDKDHPNNLESAVDIWNDIHDPITDSFLRGLNFDRLFAQNNIVKRLMLDAINPNSIVIDIGTGRGGDLGKYRKGAHVICVEPDPVNFAELKRRHANLSPNECIRFSLLGCGGEETEVIMEHLDKVLRGYPAAPITVVSMLSLTFFWKNRELLDRFKNTLMACAYRRETTFVAYTIGGRQFLSYINERGIQFEVGPLSIKYDSSKGGVSIPGTVTVKIDGQIVRGQDEYFVNLGDLRDVVKATSRKPGLIEPYLTAEEKAYGETHVQWCGKVKSFRYTKMSTLSSIVIGTESIPEQAGSKLFGDYIALPPDPDQYFGTFLLAVSNHYQNSDVEERSRMARALRDEFATILAVENPSVTLEEVRQMYGGSPFSIFPQLSGRIPENAYVFTLSQGTVQMTHLRQSVNPLEILENGFQGEHPVPPQYLPLLVDFFRINLTLASSTPTGFTVHLNYRPYPGQRRLLVLQDNPVRIVGRLITQPGVQPLIKMNLY